VEGDPPSSIRMAANAKLTRLAPVGAFRYRQWTIWLFDPLIGVVREHRNRLVACETTRTVGFTSYCDRQRSENLASRNSETDDEFLSRGSP
jgi:hypothetical protein